MSESSQNKLGSLSWVISLLCFILLLIHTLLPQYSIDTITISLLLIMIFPWIMPYIKSINFPGGGGIELRDELKRLKRLSKRSNIKTTPDTTFTPGFFSGTMRVRGPPEPFGSLIEIRDQLSEKITALGTINDIDIEGHTTKGLLRELERKKTLERKDFIMIMTLYGIITRAIGGEAIDINSVDSILSYGNATLEYLDSITETIKNT